MHTIEMIRRDNKSEAEARSYCRAFQNALLRIQEMLVQADAAEGFQHEFKTGGDEAVNVPAEVAAYTHRHTGKIVHCLCEEFEFDATARLIVAVHPGDPNAFLVHAPHGCEVLQPGKIELQLLYAANRK